MRIDRRPVDPAIPAKRRQAFAGFAATAQTLLCRDYCAAHLKYRQLSGVRIYPASGTENCELSTPKPPFSQIPPQAAPRPQPVGRVTARPGLAARCRGNRIFRLVPQPIRLRDNLDNPLAWFRGVRRTGANHECRADSAKSGNEPAPPSRPRGSCSPSSYATKESTRPFPSDTVTYRGFRSLDTQVSTVYSPPSWGFLSLSCRLSTPLHMLRIEIPVAASFPV